MRFHEHFEISCHDVDENNNIKPTALLRYINDVADHQMRDRQPSYMELFKEGKAFIVTRMNIEIYGQLHQYDEIDAYTWRCEGKNATFPRCYEIRRDGEIVVQVYSEWAVVNHETGHLYRANELDISGYEKDEPFDLHLPKRYRYPKTMEFDSLGIKHVYYSDCDMNRHMNNGYYFNLLWERIPEIQKKEVTSMNIRFQHEALLDSDIEMGMAKIDPEMTKDPRAEEAYAFRTIVEDQTNVECMFGIRKTEKRLYTK